MKKSITILFLISASVIISFAQEEGCSKKDIQRDEYANSFPGSMKINFHNFRDWLIETPECEGIIRIDSAKNAEIWKQIRRLERAFNFTPIQPTRLTYILNNKSDKELVQFWAVSSDSKMLDCRDCLIIRAEDFDELQNFFKPAAKKRKK